MDDKQKAFTDHVFHTMTEIENDRKEACIHCRKVWYAIKHRDGVCHECQKKNLPGQSVLLKQQDSRRKAWNFIRLFLFIIAVIVAYMHFYG